MSRFARRIGGVAVLGIAVLAFALAGRLGSGSPTNAARPADANTAPVHRYAAPPPLPIQFHRPPRAALLFDVGSGQILWAINPTVRLPIASLTKMMTALLRSPSSPPNAHVLITQPRRRHAPDRRSACCPLGKHVRLETLLYGLLLPSGNDAAVALAEHVAGTRPARSSRR